MPERHGRLAVDAMTSAYPKPMDELIAQARRMCWELGAIPSQNKLKAALHVRAERARAVLQALNDSGFDPAATAPPAGQALPVPPDSGADPALVPASSSEPVPAQVNSGVEPISETSRGSMRGWPVMLLAAPAFVAIWSGWVGVGALTGFGPVHPLPGIASGFTINSAITLPIGVEAYAAYALRVWLAGTGSSRARRFAKRSAIAAFVLGGLGQIAYHLMTAAHLTVAPWPITTAVSCLPVVVLGFGAALAHLQQDRTEAER